LLCNSFFSLSWISSSGLLLVYVLVLLFGALWITILKLGIPYYFTKIRGIYKDRYTYYLTKHDYTITCSLACPIIQAANVRQPNTKSI
jgi:hypothetical protein